MIIVKATGSRTHFDWGANNQFIDIQQYLYAANPQSLMFGTDLPSTRAARVYEDVDFSLIVATLGEE